MKILRIAYFAIVIAYVPLLFLIPLSPQDSTDTIVLPYILIWLLLLMVSICFYLLFIQLGVTIGRFLAPEQRLTSLVFGLIELAMITVSCVLMLCEKTDLGLCFAAGLLVLWLVDAIVCRRKLGFSRELRRPVTWIAAAVVTAMVLGGWAISDHISDTKNKPDPEEGNVAMIETDFVF